ncbi:hypothetical protein OIU74_006542 [Salix koriyanagi]|uniref:Uncharacterized protein n=1 Tax=Salix koriyanagi TaxID=2511006 RepID=A0A9Q0ZBL1_9ROSI|nr:hypothetical protein OIU74_006542 [Salix koriyanagi]
MSLIIIWQIRGTSPDSVPSVHHRTHLSQGRKLLSNLLNFGKKSHMDYLLMPRRCLVSRDFQVTLDS